ncbi:MAG: hypothetical protein ABUL77_03915 [Bacteroidota bacterium]
MTAPLVGPRPAAADATATVSVGMTVALAAVSMTFGALLLAYGILRTQAPSWPPPGEAAPPAVWPWPIAATLAALAGSAAMRAAARAGVPVAGTALVLGPASGNHRLKRALIAAAAAGFAFIAVQIVAWSRLLASGVRPSAGIVASVVYALTLFHALHALAALAALLPVVFRVLRGGVVRAPALAAVSAFWHLVTIVWVVVFLTVFVG